MATLHGQIYAELLKAPQEDPANRALDTSGRRTSATTPAGNPASSRSRWHVSPSPRLPVSPSPVSWHVSRLPPGAGGRLFTLPHRRCSAPAPPRRETPVTVLRSVLAPLKQRSSGVPSILQEDLPQLLHDFGRWRIAYTAVAEELIGGLVGAYFGKLAARAVRPVPPGDEACGTHVDAASTVPMLPLSAECRMRNWACRHLRLRLAVSLTLLHGPAPPRFRGAPRRHLLKSITGRSEPPRKSPIPGTGTSRPRRVGERRQAPTDEAHPFWDGRSESWFRISATHFSWAAGIGDNPPSLPERK